MTHIAPLVALVVLLLGRTASGSGVLCTWSKVTADQRVHYSFLRMDPPSLRLYHIVWSGGERALLGCTWSDDAALIQDYRSLCRERAHDFSDHLDPLLDSVMEAEKEQCVSLAELQGHAGRRPVRSVREREDERSEVTIHQRVKRGFIVPGTLWCGSGNKAPSYADLGVFSDTDSCCREHDQCKHTILSFHSEFGVFNSNIFTMSHCDCDNKFHSCLKDANDSIAHVVGYTFFNLLKMHCFRFSHRLQCTQRNWFGMCKETKMALYAEVYPPTLFESIDPADLSMNSSINSTTAPPALLETAEPQLSSITVPTPGTFLSTSTQRRDDTETTTKNQDSTAETTTKRTTTVNRDSSAETSCSVYKDLDECRTKIRPQQKKYGLHNTETRTLYHCNCTSRLFQSLATQRQLSKVHSVLLGQVSPSCFLLHDCSAANSCSAVLLKADHPQLDVEEQLHLQAVTLKVRRPNTRRARRRDRAVRLHKLCVRMSRARIQSPQSPQSPAAGTERAE